MVSNFSFLKKDEKFNKFSDACVEAEKSIAVSPATTAILSRRALELAVKWVYRFDNYLKIPYQDNLSSLVHSPTFTDIIDPDLFPLIKYIVRLGNVAAHTNSSVKREDAVLSLHNLHQFVSWISYCYSEDYQDTEFNESILETGEEKKVKREELEKLFNELGSRDEKLKDMVSANEKLREELRKIREEKSKEDDFEVDTISEFETRKRYIDLYIKESGWLFGDDCIEEYEVQGMPYGSGTGYVDYVLFGNNGKPLAVIEAKRTSMDPNKGKQQAKLYVDCLENKFHQRPIIFYTNGFETYFWDDETYPPRRVSGIYSKDELQLVIDRRKNKTTLQNIDINNDITNRYYQKEAIKAVCETFEGGNRKTLLVMATGSGKTRTAISIVDILARHDWVKNVLFLADRTALVRQAKNSFNHSLKDMSLCNLLGGDNPNSRIVFSTYPTMMNAIDETKSGEGKKLFTIGHFDLIIVDESHRSIYKKYKAIFDYFDALLLGLTATPKDDIDKNTYHIFDLENGVPTYAYELRDAVEDKYLVPYNTVETEMKFLEDGIKYDELSEEDKEKYEETFDDDEMPDFISSDKINSWLFNDDTIDKVLNIVMEKGLKVEGGDKLGKTIIFAKNHKHAVRIVERFDILYPAYHGRFASLIDNYINYAQSLIDDFSTKEKMPQIAVSVDMLDTGIDIPEIVNLVFFKKVMSKSKFWQMIGRGTRLCEGLFGPGEDKESFLIFDFCGNFEFFRASPNGKEVKGVKSLTEKIFNTKLDLIKELQYIDYQEEKYIAYRNKLIPEVVGEIIRLNREHFVVKQHLRFVDKYKNKDVWQNIGDIALKEIKDNITHLIIPTEDDELAKRFDYLMLAIELAQLVGRDANKAKDNVVKTAQVLSNIGTIPQVLEKKEIIEKVKTDAFWATATIIDYEIVREALRDLIKFIEKQKSKIYYTNIADEVLSTRERPGEYSINNLENYRNKVNQYLREHQDHMAIYKLKNNKPLTQQDFEALEKILWNEVGTKDDYAKEFGETPLTILVRQVVGLDQVAANEAFSEFLSDQNIDTKQIRFVKSIVDYVVKNGVMDKKVLQEDPFRSIGSIIDIFPTDKAMKIVKIIDSINDNANRIMGA